MDMSATLAAKARGERVAIASLIKFDFEDAPFYAWTGAGILRVGADEYRGLGELARVDALPLGIGDSAGQASFALSGVDAATIALARSEADKVQGREVTVWKQFLSSPHTPLDDPLFLGAWVMMAPRFSFSPKTRTISVAARSIFDDRKLNSQDYYSDAYLQARYPGDLFFEYTSLMVEGLTIDWPKVT